MKKSNGIPFTKESASEAGKKSVAKRGKKGTQEYKDYYTELSRRGNQKRWVEYRASKAKRTP